jgi:hypothetical protein
VASSKNTDSDPSGTTVTHASARSPSGRPANGETVGWKSVPDVVEPVGEIPINRYNRPYEGAAPPPDPRGSIDI